MIDPVWQKDIVTRALRTYGVAAQWGMAQEECAELIAAINRYDRGRIEKPQLAEEVADVEIMCAQLRLMLGDELVDRAKEAKLDRLLERLERVKVLP